MMKHTQTGSTHTHQHSAIDRFLIRKKRQKNLNKNCI